VALVALVVVCSGNTADARHTLTDLTHSAAAHGKQWLSTAGSWLSTQGARAVESLLPESLDQEFAAWQTAHGVSYPPEEHARRLATYQANVALINAHNNEEGHTYTLAVNRFADLTHDEFKATMTPSEFSHSHNLNQINGGYRYEDVLVDEAHPVDWRKKGAVSEVKNQGQCGSCWSFSTTGSVEGLDAIATGKLKSLSEQELVDCDVTHDHGCGGGLMDYAFDYIINNGGLDTEANYPYVGEQQECNKKKEHRNVGKITGYEDVPQNNEKALMKAVSKQPVSVAIEADTFPFQFYSTGVINTLLCGTRLDHGVLVVGYGTDEDSDKGTSTPYWIVKNSWGATWGEEGFLRIGRNVNGTKGPGMCGIAMNPSYPTLDKAAVLSTHAEQPAQPVLL